MPESPTSLESPDLTALRALAEFFDTMAPAPWHAGRTVGRTLYKGDGPDDLIGVMDSTLLAEFVCAMRNALPALLAATEPQP